MYKKSLARIHHCSRHQKSLQQESFSLPHFHLFQPDGTAHKNLLYNFPLALCIGGMWDKIPKSLQLCFLMSAEVDIKAKVGSTDQKVFSAGEICQTVAHSGMQKQCRYLTWLWKANLKDIQLNKISEGQNKDRFHPDLLIPTGFFQSVHHFGIERGMLEIIKTI